MASPATGRLARLQPHEGRHVTELARTSSASTRRTKSSRRRHGPRCSRHRHSQARHIGRGHQVDVDYPTQPGVKRPTGDVQMFKSWDANQLRASSARSTAPTCTAARSRRTTARQARSQRTPSTRAPAADRSAIDSAHRRLDHPVAARRLHRGHTANKAADAFRRHPSPRSSCCPRLRACGRGRRRNNAPPAPTVMQMPPDGSLASRPRPRASTRRRLDPSVKPCDDFYPVRLRHLDEDDGDPRRRVGVVAQLQRHSRS